MSKKLWYTVQVKEVEADWEDGTFDRKEALRKMNEMNEELERNGLERDAYIAVIDADYNEDGEATTEAFCVEEIYE